jgi:hypothetical protein
MARIKLAYIGGGSTRAAGTMPNDLMEVENELNDVLQEKRRV